MTRCLVLFAQLNGLNPLNSTAPADRSAGLVFKDLLVIIATGLALGLLLLFWARHYVKRKKRHDRSLQKVSRSYPPYSRSYRQTDHRGSCPVMEYGSYATRDDI